MPQQEVTLPSGARGIVRGLKGAEINLFANQQTAQSSKTAIQILRSVWMETVDPGPLYTGEVDWMKAPQCDRFTALLFARIATFREMYSFPWRCNSGSCRRPYSWELDLRDLPRRDLPPASIASLLSRNEFKTRVQRNDGTWAGVTFQLLTPEVETRIETAQNLAPKERATVALANRIVSVEGLDSGRGPIKEFLNDLDAGPMFDLIGAMDEVDGGVETQIDIQCPHCGHEEHVELPLDRFWSPAPRKPYSPPTQG